MVAALTDTPLDTPRVQLKAPAAQPEGAAQSRGLFGADGFSFWDFLDIVNPLQHIPIVSTIYRAVTGDTIDPGARIAGGTLFGGPIGLAVSLAGAMVEEDTGKDMGQHALAMLGIDIGGETPAAAATAVAQMPPPDRVPPELLAAIQQPPRTEPNRPELKLSISPSPRDEDDEEREASVQSEGRRRAAQALPPQTMIAPQTVVPGGAPSQTDQAAAMIAARAHGWQPGTRSAKPAAATPVAAPQVIDGRTWFPAFPQGGGGAPTRGVGAQPVTQQNAVSKFGVTRGASDQGAAFRSDTPPSADWAERAAAAYQKYSDMHQQRDRQKALDARY